MKFKLFFMLITLTLAGITLAQVDLIFKNSMEQPVYIRLNDTGITWSGNYPESNFFNCIANVIQDCDSGRDATDDDDSDGHAGFSFTKLDNNGNSLDASAKSWNCVKDNVTGLTWEVKTVSEGIHFNQNKYEWGGVSAIGREHPDREGDYSDDWNSLVEGSNTQQLCGFDDWRVPTAEELTSIMYYKFSYLYFDEPKIDLNYFPNSFALTYWSSSPNAENSGKAFYVHLGSGSTNANGNRIWDLYVRLVRNN